MVKMTVLYGPPKDPAAFEDHYAGTHAGLVDKIPNLKRFEPSKVVGTPDGSEPPYYRIAELVFDGNDELQAALGSDEGRAAVDDMGNFASGGATVLISALD
jgi:uncharacterized protein (TIGR02118 family)